MTSKIIKPELLSPAGSPAALIAAVQNGADAVYLGEKSFSARKNAVNFSWEELKEATSYCHTRDVKVYLTLNTLIKENELKDFENTVCMSAESGIDAIIVQDLGAADIIRKVCPEMPIHASTQMTASNEYDVQALCEKGFSRVVLSRELSEKEIRGIHKNCDAELEVFVHGALCISFSGKCLMSSFIGGRSGNRGACAQPCRKLYKALGREGYFLSPRDLCLADEILSLQNAGVSSFKIEGRMKSPEYVATVTNVYRKYIDNPQNLSDADEDRLKKIFVRGDGFTKGYFSGINTPQIMNYTMSNDDITQRADETVLSEARHSYREGVENKKVPVDAYLEVKLDKPTMLTFTDGTNSVKIFGNSGEKARNLSLSPESAKDRIAKLGQTPFELRDFSCDIEEGITLSAAAINKLRRDCAEALSDIRGQIKVRKAYPYNFVQAKKPGKKDMKIHAQISLPEQFDALRDADKILVPLNLWDKIVPNDRCVLVLPQVVTDADALLHKLSGIKLPEEVYVSSLGMLSLMKEKGIKAHLDWGANIANSISANEIEGASSITLSPEISLAEIGTICASTTTPCEAIAYGKQTVMTSRACLIRGITGKCDCSKPLSIKDKTGAVFTIFGDEFTHLNTVLNSRPTFMADKLDPLKKSGLSAIRLVFTDENAQNCAQILDMYKGKQKAEKPPIYTRGYFVK